MVEDNFDVGDYSDFESKVLIQSEVMDEPEPIKTNGSPTDNSNVLLNSAIQNPELIDENISNVVHAIPKPFNQEQTGANFHSIAAQTTANLKKYYNTDNVRVEIADSGIRSPEIQKKYLEEGSSWTDLGLHNFGAGADYNIYIDDELITGTGESKALKHSVDPYRILGGVAKQYKYFWGWGHDSRHVATHRFVNQLLETYPELAESDTAKSFYQQYLEKAPNKLKPVLSILDSIYGQSPEREYEGPDRTLNPLLKPIGDKEIQDVYRQRQQQELAKNIALGQYSPEINPQDYLTTAEPSSIRTEEAATDVPIVTLTPGAGEFVKAIADEGATRLLESEALFGKDLRWLNTPEFKNLKDPIIFAKNVFAHVAEFPFMMGFDIPASATRDPIGTLEGFFHFFKDEGIGLLNSINANPYQHYLWSIGKGDVAKEMKNKAQKHIFDTGGVYTYFAASGLVRAGIKTKSLLSKNKELVEIVDMSEGKAPKGEVTAEMETAVEALNKNPKLKRKAKQVVNEQLSIDYLEKAEVDVALSKAEAINVAKQLDMFPDKSKSVGKKRRSAEEIEADAKYEADMIYLKEHRRSIKEKPEKTKEDLDAKREAEQEYIKQSREHTEGTPEYDAKLKREKEVKERGRERQKKAKKRTRVGKNVISERIQLESAKDLKPSKLEERIKGERARRFKYEKGLEKFIADKMSEYLGDNIVIRHGKTKGGDIIAKVFRHTKEQKAPITALKRPPMKIKTDKQEVVSSMRDPRSRGIENRKILVEKYTEEVSELRRGRDANNAELVDLKLKQEVYDQGLNAIKKREKHYLDKGDIKKAEIEARKKRKYVDEHGVGLENRISNLESAINSFDISINRAKSQRRSEMSKLDIAKDTASKVSRLTSRGAIGGKKAQKLSKEQLDLRFDIAENVKEIWARSKHSAGEMTRKTLSDVLNAEKWSKGDIAFALNNIKDIKQTAQVQSAKQLARELDIEGRQGSDAVRNTETKTRSSDEYIANIRKEMLFPYMPDQLRFQVIDLVENIVNKVGGEGMEVVKGTRSIDTIQRGGASKRMIASVADELMSGRLSVELLPEKANAVANLFGEILRRYVDNPNEASKALVVDATKMLSAYISEPARTVRAFRDMKTNDIRDILEKNKKGLSMDADVVEALNSILSKEEVSRSSLHKVAEYARNMKLATGSSLVRSLAGNSISMIDAWARMPFEIGFDWLIGKSSSGLNRLSMGWYGNLNGNQMSKLEIGAAWRGFRAGVPEAGKLVWDMLLERDNALDKSSFYRRERLHHKEISGTKGVLIRTPQRLQGMIDILGRVPLTSAYMHRFAVRQAIREGRKTQHEIVSRAEEIMNMEKLDPILRDEAIAHGEYATFQSQLGMWGSWVNKFRTGGEAPAALAQILVPFFNTASNLF